MPISRAVSDPFEAARHRLLTVEQVGKPLVTKHFPSGVNRISTFVNENPEAGAKENRAARRGAAWAGLALLLAACGQGLTDAPPSRTAVAVGGTEVVIAAPPGFCIDPRSTSRSDAGAFVLASDCALLGGTPAQGEEPVGAVMTASVSAAPQGGTTPAETLATLATFAATPAGRGALGRSGDGASTRILATRTTGEVLYLLVEDAGAQTGPALDRRFWRAFLDTNGRTTVLSLLAFPDAGLDPELGLALITAFAEAVQRANR